MDIERVSKLTILGVVVNNRLSADDHVTSIIASCSKSLYALRVLKTHRMPASALHKVFAGYGDGEADVLQSSLGWVLQHH